MKEKNTAKIGRWEYLFLGIAVLMVIFLFILRPEKTTAYDNLYIEVLISEKEIAAIDGKDVYLLHTEDRYGQPHIYEITKAAIGHFEEEEVYQEIKTGKYYKLKIADEEQYNSHYPCICGAVKLIDGFSPEESQ